MYLLFSLFVFLIVIVEFGFKMSHQQLRSYGDRASVLFELRLTDQSANFQSFLNLAKSTLSLLQVLSIPTEHSVPT